MNIEIRCKHIGEIQKQVAAGVRVHLGTEKPIQEGSGEFARMQILESLGAVDCGEVLPRGSQVEQQSDNEIGIDIEVSTDPRDVGYMQQALELRQESHCWWRPTACVVIRNDELLVFGVSSNLWGTNCKQIPLSPGEIRLDPGEKIDFCDAIHAEKVAIAEAAKVGIPIGGSTFYVTTSPCEECAKALIVAGVKRVVFGFDYYDKQGLELLAINEVKLSKIAVGEE